MVTPTNEIWVQEGDVRRKLEGEELKAFLDHCAELEAKKVAELKAAEDAKKAKETAAAKLAALGLTSDDLKALGLGGN